MSVASPTVHPESRQPPPIPIQLEEYSASPRFRCFAFGTIHSAVTAWNVVPFSRTPCMWPDQLNDSFAATTVIVRVIARAAGDVGAALAGRRSSATSAA